MKTFLNTVNGRPVESDGRTFESVNPATGQALGLVPHASASQIDAAVTAARNAQPGWAALTDAERGGYLMKVADAINANAEVLAQWVTKEQGKPLGGVGPGQVPGARFELWACEVWTRVPAGLELPMEIAYEDDTRRDEIHRVPYGVVVAIAPWNWPLLIAIWQIVPALRAGNTVVIKPSEYTSIGTLEMVRLIAEVLPPGVLNTVSGPGDVGAALVDHPGVDKITFTGSGASGAKIAAAAAKRLVPTTLELGGNDAAIVLADVDPKAVAMDLFWGSFINMGQTCACVKRIYAHDRIHDALVEELAAIARAMPIGDGTQDGVAMGPIQNRAQYDKIVSLVESARRDGGHIVCGGSAPKGPGYFYPPTIVTGLRDGSRLVDEEQFGPVLPVIRFSDIDQAVANANRVAVGLGASVWSADARQAREIGGRLQAGTVWINQHGAIHPMVPFGGAKQSGWGVEFGRMGLSGMTRPQVISLKKPVEASEN